MLLGRECRLNWHSSELCSDRFTCSFVKPVQRVEPPPELLLADGCPIHDQPSVLSVTIVSVWDPSAVHLYFPDLFCIVPDGSVRRELPDPGHIQKCLPVPLFRVFVKFLNLILGFPVSLVIRQDEKIVPFMEQGIDNGLIQLLVIVKEPIPQLIQNLLQIVIGIVYIPGIVPFMAQFIHIFYCVAEDENILITYFFPDLHIGTIQGSNCEGSVQSKFHIPGAGGFKSSS